MSARFILAAAIVMTLSGGLAIATHTEPGKGKRVQLALLDGYRACDTPNTAAQSDGSPACAPPVSDSFFGCGFLPTGSGKLTLKTVGSAEQGTEDIKLTVVANGLNDQCLGQLCVVLSFRATTDDCPEGSCTRVDFNDVPLAGACCTLANGKCKLATTLSAAAPGLFANGKHTGVEIYGCGLTTLLPLADRSFRCGFLFK